MPRRLPPPGYYTSAEAQQKLNISEGMFYKYVRAGHLKRYMPETRKQGFYLISEVDKLATREQDFFAGPAEPRGRLEFAQATPDDMEGVYAVASKLFEHTTSADDRKPLVARCSTGNYIIRDKGRIVAYIHIQPLRHDRLMAFMRGEIRGWQLTADDLDCFQPDQSVACLVKSMGAYHRNKQTRIAYMQRLLNGTAHEIAKLGSQGVNITRIYATSETDDGITMSVRAEMQSLGLIPGSAGKKRYAFMLDVATSHLALLQPYKRALASYRHANNGTNTPTSKKTAVRSLQPPKRALEKSTLPDGLVVATAFGEAHGIAATTVQKAMTSGRLPVAPGGPWKVGRTTVTKALDQAGRARFYGLYSTNIHFTPCPECPHT